MVSICNSDEIVQQIVIKLRKNENEENRAQMEAYMKNHFSFLGIKTPQRKQLLKPILNNCRSISATERYLIAWKLFNEKEREFHYAALALLEMGAKKAPVSAIGFYKELLMRNSWWDSVDMIASNLCGAFFKQHPHLLVPITEEWRRSHDMWVRRSSLLHQLKFKELTNERLLFETIDILKHEQEFFLEKAIGWSLREYSKTNPDAVKSYIETTELRPLSRREGLRWLKSHSYKL